MPCFAVKRHTKEFSLQLNAVRYIKIISTEEWHRLARGLYIFMWKNRQIDKLPQHILWIY